MLFSLILPNYTLSLPNKTYTFVVTVRALICTYLYVTLKGSVETRKWSPPGEQTFCLFS